MLITILHTLFSMLGSREALILENAALRHQIEVLQRNSTRPALRWRDRAFWDILSCLWPDWRQSLFIVQPETVIRWHRQGFRYYWRWKSRYRWPGRPRAAKEARELIRQMSLAISRIGEPHAGIETSQATVSKYLVTARPFQFGRPSWSTMPEIWSRSILHRADSHYRVLYVFVDQTKPHDSSINCSDGINRGDNTPSGLQVAKLTSCLVRCP